ncbi:MAG: hypothetical protein H7333_06470, partial [Bdellovibrionales bacterium]|nr:hypothetical protein [Oligoflexia bacterium]
MKKKFEFPIPHSSLSALALLVLFACNPLDEAQKILRSKFIDQPKEEPVRPVSLERGPGALARENSELLSEMMKVVFDEEEVDSKSDFGTLAHTLNQGASLEGIYRGIVMGSRYRAMETKNQAASPEELKAFAIELSELQDSMKNPSTFEMEEAKKAPSIEYPDGSVAVPHSIAGSQEVLPKRDKIEVRDGLVKIFIGASGYTLKRTLGEEALKKIDEMKMDSGELAQWYARFVLRMCLAKVDFGLELRNKPDFDLHFKFAQKMA